MNIYRSNPYFLVNSTHDQNELYHYGVLGMKWGVRRYQKKDGSLTENGKKQFAKSVSSRRQSYIGAVNDTRKNIDSVKEIRNYKSNKSYRSSLKTIYDYRRFKDRYLKKYEAVRRDVIPTLEKKYGKYEDLERKQDISSMEKFNNAYDKAMQDRGVYSERQTLQKKYERASAAKERINKETRQFVSEYLGKYGNKKLKGQGSAIYKGRRIVDRLTVNDVMVDAIVYDTKYEV